MSLIETINLGKRHGERDILKDINLKVNKGEVFALLGPTGAGKTTLLHLIDLLDTPTSGKIYFDGVDVTEARKLRFEMRRRMTFVLQKPVVFNMSVYDKIAYGLKWRRMKTDKIKEKVSNIIEVVGLTPYKNRNARTLSGGETQRVAIARAIVIEPEVLLLDEPTANLDPTSASKIEELISKISHQYNTTIVMATHDMPQGQRLANSIAVMINGEILQIGDSASTFNLPRNIDVAEFVGVENIWEGVITANEGGIVTVDIGSRVIEAISDLTAGNKVYACIRPENITLAPSTTPSSARNSFSGKITGITSQGPLARITLDCGFPMVSLVTKRSTEKLNLAIDSTVYATFKATGIHIISKKE